MKRTEGINGLMIQYFEWYLADNATLWKQVKAAVPTLKLAGISAIWLPPAYKGASGIHSVGYDVYDLYDCGEFNQKGSISTKYGTKAEYLEAVRALKDAGIYILADMVFNQKMGADETEEVLADEVDPYNRNRQISGDETIKAWSKFTFPGRGNKYSDFKWNHNHFDATDYNADNHQNALYRFKTKSFDQDVDSENGNYDYLMGCDIDFENQEVIDELQRYGFWYLDQFPVDGFRLDAVKHIDFEFFRNWLTTLRNKEHEELFAVGEYWSGNLENLKHFLEVVDFDLSLFDVPLHYHFFIASRANGNYDLRTIFDNTLTSIDPTKSVSFVDNHDSQPHQALESWVLPWFKPLAYALILLRVDGYPCIFYGDLYGIPHDNYEGVTCLRTLTKLRQNSAFGPQLDYFDDPACIGWTRLGDDAHPDNALAIIMSIKEGRSKWMEVGVKFAGSTFIDALGNSTDAVIINQDGWGEFKCNGGSVSVYIKQH